MQRWYTSNNTQYLADSIPISYILLRYKNNRTASFIPTTGTEAPTGRHSEDVSARETRASVAGRRAAAHAYVESAPSTSGDRSELSGDGPVERVSERRARS